MCRRLKTTGKILVYLLAVPLAVAWGIVMGLDRRFCDKIKFNLTSSEKERILHEIQHANAPQEFVDTVQATLEAISPSTLHTRYRSRDAWLSQELYYNNKGGRVLYLTYYSGDLGYMRIFSTPWSVSFRNGSATRQLKGKWRPWNTREDINPTPSTHRTTPNP